MSGLQPWHWRSQPLCQQTGSEVFAALFLSAGANPGEPGQIATLLESPGTGSASPLSRYSICAGPPRCIDGQAQVWTPPLGQILPTLRSRLGRSLADTSTAEPPADLPFQGGWLGWLGYDLAWEIEQLPWLKPEGLPFPVAFWYEPAEFAVLDHQQQVLWLATTQAARLDALQQRLEQADPQAIAGEKLLASPQKLQVGFTQADYEAAVRQAQNHIQAGDIFQANLSLRFSTQVDQSPWQIYAQLQKINPSPFASYWQTPWGSVVSCSPERLVQLQGSQAQTRPIAGTRSRGASAAQDQAQADDLLSNEKEIAEHVMLVDLERNDLGRVCQWGSIKVDELLSIERYSHVMHLVSNVRGQLRADQDAMTLIQALFPGGTITGCPKIRCMEIIEQLEPVRRSLFYGSCGYLDWRGNLDLNILIRTLLLAPQPSAAIAYQVWGQVGAGIVADSDPTREWLESLQKAKAQLLSLGASPHFN
ncbi:anthranilate synthase component I [Almyronema epifaneia S1]|uniref:Anthranilate synthase component 1 n=1 Tax=Almyronema epifaneia S1 TaxID=2991925 RepID=A0ABW6IJE0_9CYAN